METILALRDFTKVIDTYSAITADNTCASLVQINNSNNFLFTQSGEKQLTKVCLRTQ